MHRTYESDINAVALAGLCSEDDLRQVFEKAGVPFTDENVEMFLNSGTLDQLEEDLADQGSEILENLLQLRRSNL